MSKRILVMQCDPSTIQWLQHQPDTQVEITPCATLEEIRDHLRGGAEAGVMIEPLRQPRFGEGDARHAAPAASNGRGMVNGTSNSSYAHATAVASAEGDFDEAAEEAVSGGGKLAEMVDRFEQRIIEQTLARHGNHRKDTAAELGISRVTLYNKMKKFGMLND